MLRRLCVWGPWILRPTAWTAWLLGTLLASQGKDPKGAQTLGDSMLGLTFFFPLLPSLFVILCIDAAGLRHGLLARRFYGREAYERFVAELRRQPDIPGHFGWSARAVIIALPVLLFGLASLVTNDGSRDLGLWMLSIFYSALLSIVLVIADIRARKRYYTC